MMNNWEESPFFGMANREGAMNLAAILHLLEKVDGAGLLDIGCNAGSFSVEVGKAIGTDHIAGIDIDPECLKAAEAKGIRAVCHDANTRFPFPDSSFDVVIANQLLEHLNDADVFFAEVHRVLKSGGYAVISTPNLSSLHNIFFLVMGQQPPGLQVSRIQAGNFLRGTATHGHIRLFTAASLGDLAKYHGFTVERIIGTGFYPFPERISALISRLFRRYAVYIIIKIRKGTPFPGTADKFRSPE